MGLGTVRDRALGASLLIITQKVDQSDQLLGFFIEWIRLLAGRFREVTVLCLERGTFDLPHNVRVFTLGKDRGFSKARQLFNFYWYIVGFHKSYDAAFIHMNPGYVIYGGLVWRFLRKKIVLWYAHGHVDMKLRLAGAIADLILTSTPEGYRLPGPNVRVVGQGIDVSRFAANPKHKIRNPKQFRIISVGRISPSKDYETLIAAIEILRRQGQVFHVRIAGQPALERDQRYLEFLKREIDRRGLHDVISLVGPIPHTELPEFLNSADLFVNMSHTGSLDKAILEAMACGIPVLTCNEALVSVLGDYRDRLMYPKSDAQSLAGKIAWAMQLDETERTRIGTDLRLIVIRDHSLTRLIETITPLLGGRTDMMMRAFDERALDDYERRRWFQNPLARAGYDMTSTTIRRRCLGKPFTDYLELGPGPGTWTKLFLEKNGAARCDLVDISGEMLKLAQENLAQYPSIRCIRSDFLDFNPERAYNMFFSSRALEYLPDKKAASRKIFSLLRSGGTGCMITKTPHWLRARLRWRNVPALHQGQIAPDALKAILRDVGFRDVRLLPATMVFPLARSVFLNKMLFAIFSPFPINPVSQFFSESYLITFSKP